MYNHNLMLCVVAFKKNLGTLKLIIIYCLKIFHNSVLSSTFPDSGNEQLINSNVPFILLFL